MKRIVDGILIIIKICKSDTIMMQTFPASTH